MTWKPINMGRHICFFSGHVGYHTCDSPDILHSFLILSYIISHQQTLFHIPCTWPTIILIHSLSNTHTHGKHREQWNLMLL